MPSICFAMSSICSTVVSSNELKPVVPRVHQPVSLSLFFQDFQETISASFNNFVLRQEFPGGGTNDQTTLMQLHGMTDYFQWSICIYSNTHTIPTWLHVFIKFLPLANLSNYFQMWFSGCLTVSCLKGWRFQKPGILLLQCSFWNIFSLTVWSSKWSAKR